MTVSLGSLMFNNIVEVSRSSLYYSTWQYVLLLHLPDASFLRELKHNKIDQRIGYRNGWIAGRGGGQPIDNTTKQILHDACDYLLARKHPYKKVVCGNGIWLYTNNLEDFEHIDSIPTGKTLYVNQARVTLSPDAVTLMRPQHQFRTYFRDRWVSDSELTNIRQYFRSRKDMFRLGPGFAKVINGKRLWLMSNHFVDHNEPNADLLINIAVPGIVRKTLPIIARAK